MTGKTFFMIALAGALAWSRAGNDEKTKTSDPESLTVAPRPRPPRPRRGNEAGGAGGFSVMMSGFDWEPVRQITEHEQDLANKSFDFTDEDFMLIGGMGYGGRRNRGRIGGGGWFGYTRIYSEPYEGTVTDSAYIAETGDSTIDSIAELDVMLTFGGVIAEKSINISAISLYAGGMWGGGALILRKSFSSHDEGTAFVGRSPHRDEDEEVDPGEILGEWAAAPLMVFDLHAGASYSFATWMQVGFDAFVMWLNSSEGFGYGYDPIRSTNTGIRLRVLFGNLG